MYYAKTDGSPARIQTPVSCVQGRRDNHYATGNDPQIGPQMIPDRLTINMEWTQIWTVVSNFI